MEIGHHDRFVGALELQGGNETGRAHEVGDGLLAVALGVVVLGLLGLFYVLPPVYGALGRLYAPDLIASDRTDTVVLELPSRMVEGLGGELLSALTTAGAFAAFLSTTSGLVVSLAGVISQCISAEPGNRPATAEQIVSMLKKVESDEQ